MREVPGKNNKLNAKKLFTLAALAAPAVFGGSSAAEATDPKVMPLEQLGEAVRDTYTDLAEAFKKFSQLEAAEFKHAKSLGDDVAHAYLAYKQTLWDKADTKLKLQKTKDALAEAKALQPVNDPAKADLETIFKENHDMGTAEFIAQSPPKIQKLEADLAAQDAESQKKADVYFGLLKEREEKIK